MGDFSKRTKFELDEKYIAFGWFYNINGQTNAGYRSVLEIIRKSGSKNEENPYIIGLPADLIAIMMNPGGSKPKYSNEIHAVNSFKEIYNLYSKQPMVSAFADKTQYQLMRLMERFSSVNRIRVINLVDDREADSNKLNINPEHSIFSQSRLKEVKFILQEKTPIILGYGAKINLKKQMQNVAELIQNRKVFGAKGKADLTYYHPLRRYQPTEKWVIEIANQIDKESIFK